MAQDARAAAKINLLTDPIISCILPAVREERVGGTHPLSLQLW